MSGLKSWKVNIFTIIFLFVIGTLFYAALNFDKDNKKNPTKDTMEYIRSILKIVRENSLYADSLDWNVIDSVVMIKSNNITDIEGCSTIARYIISNLQMVGDNHSLFLKRAQIKRIMAEDYEIPQFASSYIESNIGYIRIPEFYSINEVMASKFAAAIQDTLRVLDSSFTINSWVIDLRGNLGGNMHPMIAGLAPIIGEGVLGYFICNDGRERSPWVYSNGTLSINQEISIAIGRPYHLKKPDPIVAVLVDKMTSSSGEMTAGAFIGRKSCRIFGESTAGYTTVNKVFFLPDSAVLSLAICWMADRTLKIHPRGIIPDVALVNRYADGKDYCLEAATRWLQTSRK